MKLKRFTLSLASLASLSLLVACSQRAQQVQQPVAQSQTQQTQQSQPAASSSAEIQTRQQQVLHKMRLRINQPILMELIPVRTKETVSL